MRRAPGGLAEAGRTRNPHCFIGGVVALVVVLVLGIGLGSVWIAPDQTVAILVHRLLGIDLGVRWTPAAETIVVDLRLPRVLSAMVVGAGLAVAGATYQGLLRNPLADPYVLGTASGSGAPVPRSRRRPRRTLPVRGSATVNPRS